MGKKILLCWITPLTLRCLSSLRFKQNLRQLPFWSKFVAPIRGSSVKLDSHTNNDSAIPIIAHNVSMYKYTSVYLNEKKIYMFVCHCNRGAETCRIWFLATIGDHKQGTNLNNVWLSGQVQSHKYQALCVFLWAKPWEFFGGVLCNFAHRASIWRYKIRVSCYTVTT